MSILRDYYRSIDRNLAETAEATACQARTYQLRENLFRPTIFPIVGFTLIGAFVACLESSKSLRLLTTTVGLVLGGGYLLVVLYRSSTFGYESFTGRKLSDAAKKYNAGYTGPDW